MKNYCGWCHQADMPFSLPGQTQVQTASKFPTCPQCHRAITLITMRKACELVSKSKRTLYQWIDKGLVSMIRSASGSPLICLTSLFIPSDEELNKCPQKKEDDTEEFVSKPEI